MKCMANKADIQAAFQAFCLRTQTCCESFHTFLQSPEAAELPQELPYDSPDEVVQDIVLDSFQTTLKRLADAPEFAQYSAREQALALYFTWLDTLTPHKELLRLWDQETFPGFTPTYLHTVTEPFEAFVVDLVLAGQQTGEIAQRRFIQDQYPNTFWLQTRFLIHQWLQDDTTEGTQTDAAVEKTVNFCFDMLNPNLLDSGLDFLKFVFTR